MIELTAGKDDAGRRLDRVLRKALPDLSLSLIHRLLRQKKILIDNKPASLNYRIEQGMVIKVYAPVTHINNQVYKKDVNQKKLLVNSKNSANCSPLTAHCSLLPEILWQGSGVIVFNKPQGLSTHGPNSVTSIVNAWLDESGTLPRSLSFRPGPLHRLDKPTSGIIIFSQTLEGAKLFSALIRERKLEKTYLAIVEGRIEGEITWRDALARDQKARKSSVQPADNPEAKEAVTIVKPLAVNSAAIYGAYSLIEARIKTGRHHQIRAQAASHGHPLAGDIKYGRHTLPDCGKSAFFLHAWKITCAAPDAPDGFPSEITAPLPEAFKARIEALFGCVNL